MEQRKWQVVPEMPQAFVYPYIRRPDVLSCNSYLVHFPDAMVMIDSGALPQQTLDLQKIMADRMGEKVLPLAIFLTHCHFDHSHEVWAFLNNSACPAWLASHEEGAKALADADDQKTAAELYGVKLKSVQAQIPLLTEEDLRECKPRCITLANGVAVQIRTESVGQGGVVRQLLELGGGQIEVVACPGHSPDSICYRIGEILFIGDLLLAHRPLVAGICGWNNQQLTQSLDEMIHLLEVGGISWCCPGHGNPLPAEKTLGLLRRQRNKASQFDNVEAMSSQRLFQTVDMALELIDEAEEVFSAIAGRLLYVADRLEMLEEEAAAQRCRAAMDMDAIDAVLHGFRDLCRSLSTGKILQVSFAVEATGMVEKLRQSFVPESLSAILPASLINRGNRLLLDFMGIAQGTRNLEEFVPMDIGDLLADVKETWLASPHADAAIVEYADNNDLFVVELVRRIGHPPMAQRIPVRFEMVPCSQMVHVAAVRFADTMIQFLEWLALVGAESVVVEYAGDTTVEIRTPGWQADSSPRMRAKLRSFARRFSLAGFELKEAETFCLTHQTSGV